MTQKIVAQAHGRVNLIGEHTDYNGGWVLPTSIPQYTEIVLEKRNDQKVQLISERKESKREYIYNLGEEIPTDSWVDYLQGITKFLAPLPCGFNVHISSNIPEGSGLSSSAALEMSFLKALKELFELPHTATDLALLGQKVENEFVGARVGIMDQMATSLAQENEAIFLDTLDLSFERVSLPMEEMDLLVINSGITHRLSSADGGYNQRRAECEEAAKICGAKFLRDVTLEDLKSKDLHPQLIKRARHVISENSRVKEAVLAIKNKNLPRLGELFYASHASMRDDFEVSIPEIDLLVNLASQNKNVYGARLTGGGFGGSVVIITKKGTKEEVARELIPRYEKETGSKGTVLV
jgi:galactokinase